MNEFDAAQFEATGFNRASGGFLLELRLHGAGYRRPITGNQVSRADFETNSSLEALLQRYIPGPPLDIGCLLVVAVFASGSYEWRC